MKFEKYNTFYDFCKLSDSYNFNLINLFNDSKLFIIHTLLFKKFQEDNANNKQQIYPRINDYEPNGIEFQNTLNLPFNKIFIEFDEPCYFDFDTHFKFGIWNILGFLVENNIENDNDSIFITLFYQTKDSILSFPIKINKYLSLLNPKQVNTTFVDGILITNLNNLGYNYNISDVPKQTQFPINLEFNFKLENGPIYNFMTIMNNLLVDIIDVIQFINCANGEIVYLGTSDLDYKKRIKRNEIPYPQAYTIYLKETINKKGFLFDGEQFNPKYIFDVRGHFRIYRNRRYIKMQGKRQWINPFKKGKGLYIKKDYKLTKKDIR